jgi:hypothetical protein
VKKLVAIAFVLSAIGAATAGYKTSYAVYVYSDGHSAYGNLGRARNITTDNNQYIGCHFRALTGYSYATCFARDASGTAYASCYTEDPELKLAARSLTSDGYVQFNGDSNGNCTQIIIYNASYYEPKN